MKDLRNSCIMQTKSGQQVNPAMRCNLDWVGWRSSSKRLLKGQFYWTFPLVNDAWDDVYTEFSAVKMIAQKMRGQGGSYGELEVTIGVD